MSKTFIEAVNNTIDLCEEIRGVACQRVDSGASPMQAVAFLRDALDDAGSAYKIALRLKPVDAWTFTPLLAAAKITVSVSIEFDIVNGNINAFM